MVIAHACIHSWFICEDEAVSARNAGTEAACDAGIDAASTRRRKKKFGENTFTAPRLKTYCEFVYESFEDPVSTVP